MLRSMRLKRLNLLGGRGLKAQLLRGGASSIGIRVLALLSTLLSSVVLARLLGDASFGIYVFVLAITTLLTIPVSVGLPTLVIRETASAEVTQDWVAMRSIRDWAFLANLGLGAATVGLILLVTWASGDRLTPEWRQALWLAGILVVPLALTSTFGAVLRGLRRIIAGLVPGEVVRPLLLSALVMLAWQTTPERLDAVTAILFNVLATLLVATLLFVLMRRAGPEAGRNVKDRVFKTRLWLGALVPLAMMSGLHLINQNTDLVMLGLFRETAEVGHYKVAVSGAGLVIFGLTAIQVMAMPYVSRFHAEGDQGRLQRLAGVCAGASVLLALPVVALFYVWGKPLLSLVYGPAFVAAWEPLLLLSLAQLMNGAFGIVWPLLVMTGHEKQGFRALAIATAANVVLNALLIPIWGTVGAALATGSSVIIWNVLFWATALRCLGVDASVLGLFRRQTKQGKATP